MITFPCHDNEWSLAEYSFSSQNSVSLTLPRGRTVAGKSTIHGRVLTWDIVMDVYKYGNMPRCIVTVLPDEVSELPPLAGPEPPHLN